MDFVVHVLRFIDVNTFNEISMTNSKVTYSFSKPTRLPQFLQENHLKISPQQQYPENVSLIERFQSGNRENNNIGHLLSI